MIPVADSFVEGFRFAWYPREQLSPLRLQVKRLRLRGMFARDVATDARRDSRGRGVSWRDVACRREEELVGLKPRTRRTWVATPTPRRPDAPMFWLSDTCPPPGWLSYRATRALSDEERAELDQLLEGHRDEWQKEARVEIDPTEKRRRPRQRLVQSLAIGDPRKQPLIERRWGLDSTTGGDTGCSEGEIRKPRSDVTSAEAVGATRESPSGHFARLEIETLRVRNLPAPVAGVVRWDAYVILTDGRRQVVLHDPADSTPVDGEVVGKPRPVYIPTAELAGQPPPLSNWEAWLVRLVVAAERARETVAATPGLLDEQCVDLTAPAGRTAVESGARTFTELVAAGAPVVHPWRGIDGAAIVADWARLCARHPEAARFPAWVTAELVGAIMATTAGTAGGGSRVSADTMIELLRDPPRLARHLRGRLTGEGARRLESVLGRLPRT